MKIFLTIFFSFAALMAYTQADSVRTNADTTFTRDSVQTDSLRVKDSIVHSIPERKATWKEDTVFFNSFKGPLMPAPTAKSVMQIAAERPSESKDELFWLLTGIFFFFGIIRFFFPKYIQNIFTLLFQSSFRQKQTRDQLLQDTLPSILVNILFFAVTGLFITIALQEFRMSPFDFWKTFLYASAGLMIIYILKYFFLLFFGWIFNVRESATLYSFVVFLINKIIGVLLLPLLLLVAFSGTMISNVVITVAACVVILLFIYRYITALANLRGDLHINALHFFIYLCAVEAAPLLVIFKLLTNQIGSGF